MGTPNKDGWTGWSGFNCPVPPDTKVDIITRDCQSSSEVVASGLDWKHSGSRSDIIFYRVAEDRQVGDSHEELTFHALPVVDAMSPRAEPGLAINPKDAIGSTKLPLHLFPAEAVAMGCLGMLEGREKYGENNFVAGEGVVASIYVDAAKRHLDAWFAGEENAHDTGTPHLANALATIAIIVKCQAHGKLIDDRCYSPQPGGALYRAFIEKLTPHVKRIQEMFKDKKPRHFTIADIQQENA